MDLLEEGVVQSRLDLAELNDWYDSLDSVAARYDSDCVAALYMRCALRWQLWSRASDCNGDPVPQHDPGSSAA